MHEIVVVGVVMGGGSLGGWWVRMMVLDGW